MKVNGILYCYDACPCVMGWEECDIEKCLIYQEYNKEADEAEEMK